MNKNLKIMDWLVHGGHQYEFFKAGCEFYCSLPDGGAPDPACTGRPVNKNVKYVDDYSAKNIDFDIFMVRAGVDPARYESFRSFRAGRVPGIAVMQTYLPYDIPDWVISVVWNSKAVMDKYKGDMPGKKHFYIPHGFDPSEFSFLNLKRNKRVLSASSLFEKRAGVLGFDEWKWVSENTGFCDLIGHGNDNLSESIGSFELDRLVKIYNRYSVFLNTTTKSAMPRARGEALMCGTPIITTNNFGIDSYLVDGKNCIFADSKYDMLKSIYKILDSQQLRDDLCFSGREAAIKFFNINDYIDAWNNVFYETTV